jgi:RNA methyltransferase, TrmH family
MLNLENTSMNDIITSKDNAKVKEAFKNKDGKGDTFLVEGFHGVSMALEHGDVIAVFSEKAFSCLAPVYLVAEDVLRKLASTPHPEGIVAFCRKKPSLPFTSDRLLFLDHIADPGNVGTLLRSALSFGFRDVLLSEGCAEAYSSKVLLSCQGAIFSLNVRQSIIPSLEETSVLKKDGYRLLATDLKGAVPPEMVGQEGKIALVLGNEARGVASEILLASETRIRFPMAGIDLLNVGVAGGILMYLFSQAKK